MDNTGEGLPKPIDSELSRQAVKDFVRQSDEIVSLIGNYPLPKPATHELDDHTQISISTPTTPGWNWLETVTDSFGPDTRVKLMDNPPVWGMDEEDKEVLKRAGVADDPDFLLDIGKPGELAMWKIEDFEGGEVYGSYYFDRDGNIAKLTGKQVDRLTPDHFEAVDHALHAIRTRLQPQPQVKLGVPQK